MLYLAFNHVSRPCGGMGGPVQTFLSEIIGIFSFLAMASWHLEFFSTYILLSQPLENEVIVNLTLS